MDEEHDGKDLFHTVIQLFLENRAFVKCPNCGKTLGLFEIYNEHCSYCGLTDFDEMIIVNGVGNDDPIED